MSLKISVIGAGAWGTTVAQCFADNGHQVNLWCYKESIASNINHHRTHHRLPDVTLSKSISAVTDFDQCYDADYIILGLSSSQLLSYDSSINWERMTSPVGILAKGIIEPDWFISDWVGSRVQSSVFVISGPNLALEVAQKNPAATVVASSDKRLVQDIQLALSNAYFRCYTSNDVIGVQCGGIFKNVFAIAAGVVDGLDLGDNAKSALITRGIVELQQITAFFGGKSDTIMGLSGLGDLIATCSSSKSRNWQLGNAIVTSSDSSQWESKERGETEGLRTIQLIYQTILDQSLDLPIMISVARLISQELTPSQIIQELMERGLKSETEH